jgi:hypothetical protein
MTSRQWLRRLIEHWDERGPCYGFSELMDHARNHVREEEQREYAKREVSISRERNTSA